jgi:hypothetical protein
VPVGCLLIQSGKQVSFSIFNEFIFMNYSGINLFPFVGIIFDLLYLMR